MLDREHLTLKQIRLGPSKQWTPEHEGFLFIFPKSEGGKLHRGKQEQGINQGEVLVLNDLGGIKLCAGSGELVFWFFSLHVEHLYPLFNGHEISLMQQIAESFRGLKRFAASHLISEQCHKLLADAPPKFDLDHRSQLLRVAAIILMQEFNLASKQRAGNGSPEDHLFQVFENLTAHDLLSLSVDDLAARFTCSRRHLSRLFNHHFGFSVTALRMEMRLLMATSLLRDPNVKVINVADKCGFNHLGLFNNCFKKRFGVTPGEWRKRQTPLKVEQPDTKGVFGILSSKVAGPKGAQAVNLSTVGLNSHFHNSAGLRAP